MAAAWSESMVLYAISPNGILEPSRTLEPSRKLLGNFRRVEENGADSRGAQNVGGEHDNNYREINGDLNPPLTSYLSSQDPR